MYQLLNQQLVPGMLSDFLAGMDVRSLIPFLLVSVPCLILLLGVTVDAVGQIAGRQFRVAKRAARVDQRRPLARSGSIPRKSASSC
ncbi:hypothetical protein SH661x_003210 [Planctomicrobium sp. SH661]|uniref:hypothetical protein n=1 Tax=Planctomicrobium sp. SH661 TaxID=3448124 RepID=UPI003F5C9CB2